MYIGKNIQEAVTWKSVISGKKAKKNRRGDERGEVMNKRKSAVTVLLASLLLGGCAVESQQEPEPTPIVVDRPDIRNTEAFRNAVSERVQEILSGEVTVTVYLEDAEDFNYTGTLEIIRDGSDGTVPIIFIHADKKSREGDWW